MTSTIETALASLRQARPALLIDDASDPSVGYLVAPASSISEEDVSFIVNEARGVICAAMLESKIRSLHLPMMTAGPIPDSAPDFTVSIEARRGVTTGICAADRARTLRTLAGTVDPRRDLVMPGHIFPIVARDGGVLVRAGAAEAAVDLLLMAELLPVAALCCCLDREGEIARPEALQTLAASHGIPIISILDIISHRMARETFIERVAGAALPTRYAGDFQAIAFRSLNDSAEHLALLKNLSPDSEPVTDP
ncbi:MAG: 3,4-dihydroxy-2-butanone-4-phosphate synthase, partial [Bdellovibrionales bacterium]|nr:3,4-dihydroxy-2-butanone-4-phosphate synthase [Bdellovibrionales bacterium]